MTITEHDAGYAIVDDETDEVIEDGFETRKDAYEAMWDEVNERLHGKSSLKVA